MLLYCIIINIHSEARVLLHIYYYNIYYTIYTTTKYSYL